MLKNNFEIIHLPKIHDKRGNLSFLENESQIPFKIKRTYWIYDVPGGETRGGHAFKKQSQFIISLSGSFDVNIFDGMNKSKLTLNRSYFGLLIYPLTWIQLDNFSTNSLALVVNSELYNEEDYIRELSIYNKLLKNDL